MEQYPHRVYLSLASPIAVPLPQEGIESALKQLVGFREIVKLQEEAKALLPNGSVSLSPDSLSFTPYHPTDSMNIIHQALLAARQVEISGRVKFDPNYIKLDVVHMWSIKALGLAIVLQGQIYGGGNYYYSGSYFALGTKEAIEKRGDSPRPSDSTAQPFDNLEALLAKVERLVPQNPKQ